MIIYQPMDAGKLIDDLGGSAAVAALLDVGQFAVGNWRKRGIPAWAIPAMQKLCDQQGIDPGDVLTPRKPHGSKERAA